jgi:hypothetical protein
MPTLRPCLAVLPLLALAACAPLPDDGVDSVAQEMVVPFAGNDPAREGVVQVTRAGALCTGVMLDAVTVLTGGACAGALARDYRVQLGAEVQTVDLVRFNTGGVAVLEIRRPFAALPISFTRRLSTRSAAQLNGHEMTCFGYAPTGNGGAQLGLGTFLARTSASGVLTLQAARLLTSFEARDVGTLCRDTPSGSNDVDALVLSVDRAGVATGAGAAGIAAWVDFARTVAFQQRAMLFETPGTGRCLAFDYAAGRVASVVCDQADPRQGLYQQAVAGTSMLRLRGADNGLCLRTSGTSLQWSACAATASAADRFQLQLNASATAYRIASAAGCVAASGGAVSIRPCIGADPAQSFAMRWSTY